MAVVNISSVEQFNNLLTSSRFVVADFYADWCGPCKAIAPVYDSLASQLSRPNHITFTKINGDEQQQLAQAYSVRAYPTFIVFENGRKKQTVAGADPRKLNEVIQTLASEATKSDASGTGESSTGGSWIGATPAKGYSDVSDQVEIKGLELLNRDSERGEARVLFDKSKPSGLSGKGKGKAESKSDWVESDTDEQLMLYIPFNATLKVHSLHITSFADANADENDDEVPMRPKTVSLYTNRSHVLGFDEAEDIPAVQTVEIKAEDWDAKTGTAKVDLRFVKFQNVTSLVVFFVDGDGDSEKLRVDRVRIIGDAGEKREMGKLEKIGDEPGE
ncbi:uncharacterized protein N7483_009268 [Penicillium malachiteum]|uniref:uncharacterized protein n=1 Tax=Penicillium malachiteum TaxID=1324776 RepID=UPI002547D3B5|nr:uncharacterized protein N7483_009268 [Penicillium malachiteum]KAJ5721334.1 hypothetical protein N7483_009268 [Penicillium malachiteum]